MGLESLKVGDKLQLSDGSTVEVTAPAGANARSVDVRVLDSPFGPDAPGTDKKADADVIYGVYEDDSLAQVRQL